MESEDFEAKPNPRAVPDEDIGKTELADSLRENPPDFKDQVRPTSTPSRRRLPAEGEAVLENPSPPYDLLFPFQPANQQPDADQSQFPFQPANQQPDTDQSQIPFAEVQAVQVPDIQLREEEIEGLQEKLKSEKLRRRRIWLTCSLALFVALGVIVSSVCGSGNCRKRLGDEETVEPTASPTLPPAIVVQRATEIVSLIRSTTLSSNGIRYPLGNSTGPPATPEELATEWLIDNDLLGLTVSDRGKIVQRYSVGALGYSLGAQSITSGSGFPWLSEVDECEWSWVSCINGTVSSLGLDGVGLQGQIPDDIGLMVGLEHISIMENSIAGTIPTSMGRLTNLVLIGARDNRLGGTIPTELSLLTNLRHLDLYRNELNDALPEFLAALTNLELLSLGENSLSFTIPKQLSALTKLAILQVEANLLMGSIPPELSRLTLLRLLNLFNNR